MHSVIADSAGGAWSFGGSILTFAFPMLLFIAVACALYVIYTKPQPIPGHRDPAEQRPVIYTSVPGKPPTAAAEQAPGGPRGPVPPGKQEPEGGE